MNFGPLFREQIFPTTDISHLWKITTTTATFEIKLSSVSLA